MTSQAPAAPPTAADIAAVISQYAAAYAALEDLQRRAAVAPPEHRLLPLGDQKTGAVGEFYARMYLQARHPKATIAFAPHGERGWDLIVREPWSTDRPLYVQVKCTSAHSRTRRLSPIHAGWHELLVVAVDDTFAPAGFWVIKSPEIMPQNGVLPYCCAPHPGRPKATGSVTLPFGENRVAELRDLLSTIGLTFPSAKRG